MSSPTPAPDSAAPLGTGGTAAPELLSPERLAEIEDNFEDCRGATTPDIRAAYQHIGALLAHAAALSTQLAAAKEEVEGLKQELEERALGTEQMSQAYEGAVERLKARAEKAEAENLALAQDLLAEFYAGGQPFVPVFSVEADARAETYTAAGVNAEREQNARWIKLRCAELGIAFPPQQRPAKGFDAPADAPAPALPLQGAPATVEEVNVLLIGDPCPYQRVEKASWCVRCQASLSTSREDASNYCSFCKQLEPPQNTPSAAPAVAGERRSGDG